MQSSQQALGPVGTIFERRCKHEPLSCRACGWGIGCLSAKRDLSAALMAVLSICRHSHLVTADESTLKWKNRSLLRYKKNNECYVLLSSRFNEWERVWCIQSHCHCKRKGNAGSGRASLCRNPLLYIGHRNETFLLTLLDAKECWKCLSCLFVVFVESFCSLGVTEIGLQGWGPLSHDLRVIRSERMGLWVM
jgi:hypothetical protein